MGNALPEIDLRALRRSTWKLGLAAAVAILVAYVPLRNTLVGPTVYALSSVLACAAFFAGPALQRSRGLHWKLFGAGMAFYAAADAMWAIATLRHETLPYPSAADGLYLIAYALFIAGALVLLRGTRPSTGDLLDGLLVAATAAFLIWPLVIAPSASAGGSTLLEKLISGAYPTADVLLLTGLAPIALAARARGTSHTALLAGFTTFLVADIVYAVLTLKDVYADSSLTNVAWIAANGFLVVAATHPSLRRLDEPVPRRPGALGPGRLVIITAALAVGPALGIAFDLLGHGIVEPIEPIATVTAIVLVLARIVVLWRERDRAEEALHESQARYRDLWTLAEGARAELAAKNEELLELDRLKDEFVALVSHELRTPLTSICGYIDLLREGAKDEPNAPNQRYLDVLERNGARLLTLTNDLLFITKMRAGRVDLQLGDVDLAGLAAESVEAAGPLARERRIDFAVSAAARPLLKADRSRLTQVFDNLVSNALKFTPPGGKVTISIAARNGSALVHFEDTGIGISGKDLRHLFEPFFRASSADAAAIPGTGLGLAISKGIIEAHGGQITAQSEEGRGTTFTIELPAHESGFSKATTPNLELSQK